MKKNNFLLALSLTCAFSHTAYGASKGFNISTFLGLKNIRGEHTYKNGDDDSIGTSKYNKMGTGAGLSFGYLTTIGEGHSLIGGELYGLVFGSKASKKLQFEGGEPEGSVLVRHKNAGGIAVIFGRLLNPKMFLYAKCGYEFQTYDFDFRDVTFQSTRNFSARKSTPAIAPSIGVMIRLGKNLSMGAEGTMPIVTTMDIRKSSVNINGAKRGFSSTPSAYRLLLKISYTF